MVASPTPVLDHGPVDLLPDSREAVVVVALDLGQESEVESPVVVEDPGQHEDLQGLEARVPDDGLESLEHEVRVTESRGDLLDLEVAPDGQVYQGGDHVPGLGPLVDQGPGLGRDEAGRGLVLRLDGPRRSRVPPVGPPGPDQEGQGQEGQPESPVVAQEPAGLLERRRPGNVPARPRDHDREALAWPQGTGRLEGDQVLEALLAVVAPRRAPGPG